MIELDDIKSCVGLGLEEEVRGGTIRVHRIGAENGLFGNRVPTTVPKAEALAGAIKTAIELDWAASGKKEPRVYQLTIRDKEQSIHTERQFACTPQPVTVDDIQNQALAAGLLAIQGAQDTMAKPFEQLEGLMSHQRTLIEHLQDEIKTARDRIRELERDRQGATDRELAQLRAGAESEVNRAQAEAVRTEAQAKAQAYKDLGQAALMNAPTVLSIAAKYLGVNTPPTPAALKAALPAVAALMGGGAPGAAATAPVTAGAAPKFSPPPRTMSPESAAKVRELGRLLSDKELSGFVKFAWDHDPAGQVLLPLLEPEHRELAFACLPLLAKDWDS